jgi:hypothetical protein
MSADAEETPERPKSKTRHLVGLGIFAGVLLSLIGVRFLIDPKAAQHTFGLAKGILGWELHGIIGLRDLWLGLLAVVFAVLGDWRALALWLGLGAIVCLADAAIVAATTGKWWAVAFHVGSAVFCGWLGVASWRAYRRQSERAADGREPTGSR